MANRLNMPDCAVCGCGEKPAIRLYGVGVFSGGVVFCGPHGIKYEALGYARSPEALEEKLLEREDHRRRGFGRQMHLGERRVGPELRVMWNL